MGQDGPHRLYRTCLLSDGHEGEYDFGITIPPQAKSSWFARWFPYLIVVNGAVFVANAAILIVNLAR